MTAPILSFGRDIVRVGLMLRLELEVLVCRTEEHFTIEHVSQENDTSDGVTEGV
jgi:hypothetical protein